jgi:hypothetical protein
LHPALIPETIASAEEAEKLCEHKSSSNQIQYSFVGLQAF